MRAHLGWTREDVFERYGAPVSIVPSQHTLDLRYLGATAENGAQSYVVFGVAEGLVSVVWFDL